MVEAVNANNVQEIVRQGLNANKDILVMSIGQMLNAHTLFQLASDHRCKLLFPSGAIAGVDAIKSASLSEIRQITLTTRKPPAGFLNDPIIKKKNINLSGLKEEILLFEGKVEDAVDTRSAVDDARDAVPHRGVVGVIEAQSLCCQVTSHKAHVGSALLFGRRLSPHQTDDVALEPLQNKRAQKPHRASEKHALVLLQRLLLGTEIFG